MRTVIIVLAACGFLLISVCVFMWAWIGIWQSLSLRLWEARLARFISASKRRQEELNCKHPSPDNNILKFQTHYLFTVVEGQEKRMIERYCQERGVAVSEFLARLAVEDVRSGPKSVFHDELLLALGPLTQKPKPQAVEDIVKERAVRARAMQRLVAEMLEDLDSKKPKAEEWAALYFPLSRRHYDLISRHIERGELTVRYHGRLALATIREERDVEETEII